MLPPLFLLLFISLGSALNVTVISPSRNAFDSYNAEINFAFSNYDIPIINRRISYTNIGWCQKISEKIKDYNVGRDQYLILTRLRSDSSLCEGYWLYNNNIVIALPDSLKPRSRVSLHYTDGRTFYEGHWDEFARYLFDKTRSAMLDYEENKEPPVSVGIVKPSSKRNALKQTDKVDTSRYFSSAVLVSIAILGVAATIVLMLFKRFPPRSTDKVCSAEDPEVAVKITEEPEMPATPLIVVDEAPKEINE